MNLRYFNIQRVFWIGAALSLACCGCANKVNYPVQTAEVSDVDLRTNRMVPQFEAEDIKAEEVAPFIEKYRVDAHVQGMYVQVTTEMIIRNPNNRVFSGKLEIPLPEGAVMSGYAIDVDSMDIHHQMVDGTVVDSKVARRAYEAEVKKGVDPGLLEAVRGNAFRTRIYPIMPKGYRQVRVQYTMPLTVGANGATALLLPMVKSELLERKIRILVDIPGLAKPVLSGLGNEQFAQAQAAWVFEKVDNHITPDSDLLISMPKLPDIVTSVERYEKDSDETFFAISLRTGVAPADVPQQDLSRLRLIWDASGSRKPDDIQKARQVLERIPESGHYELHVFRNVLESPVVFDDRAALLQYIDGLDYDGGTDFTPLLALADKAFDGMTLFFTDGVDTFRNDVPEFGNHSAAIISGEMYDINVMLRICGGQAYHLKTLTAEDIIQQLKSPQPTVSAVEGSHISDVQGIGISAVGRVAVVGRLNGDADTVKVRLSDGREFSVKLSANDAVTGRTITTAWAAAKVRELAPFQKKNADELRNLGKKYNIVTPNTSMIVFESLSQWVEYDIEPPDNLTEIHAKWLEAHEEKLANSIKKKEADAASWNKQITEIWEDRVKWWNDPIPPNLRTDYACEYHCSDKSYKNCEEIIVSDLYEHYRKPFKPSKKWKCEEDDANPEHCRIDYIGCSNGFGSGGEGMGMGGAGGGMGAYSAGGFGASSASSVQSASGGEEFENVEAEIELKEWDPDTPYLKALKALKESGADAKALYAEYMRQRANYETSSAFYLDVGDWFFKQNLHEYAVRILSNLTELRIDDETVLRIYAWRLRDAGMLDESIEITHKVADLRPFENISWRDLALVYEKRAKKNMSAEDAQKALAYFYKTAFDVWKDYDERNIALVAIEEFNALAAWTKRQNWPNGAPTIPAVDEKFNKLLDTDLRVIIRWDIDSTDIDLHVLEPTTEEIYYAHQRSATGGILSADITDGYGPEEYLLKSSPKGTYTLKTNYYASHVQDLIGAVTITATIFTNWGRPNQSEKSIVYRLDEEKENIIIGSFEVGGSTTATAPR